MRKILIIIFCLVSMIAYSQNVFVKNVYEDKLISKNHNMTYAGVSMGLDVISFGNKMKQKGWTILEKNGYERQYKGKLFNLAPSTIEVVNENTNEIKYLITYTRYRNRQVANSSISLLKKNISKLYPNNVFSDRKNIVDHTSIVYSWDIFSTDNKYLIGHIETMIEFYDSYTDINMFVYNIPNNFKQCEYIVKQYDLTNYVYPRCKAGYFYKYPFYQELVLMPANSHNYIRFDETAVNEIAKFLESSNYSQEEKKYVFNRALTFLEPLSQYNPSYVYDLFAFHAAQNEYDRAKEEYLKAQNKSSSQMSAGEAMFCLWEGEARIAKYKADGSYQTRMRAFIRRWNAVAGSGGGSTNWDGLSDAQKAAIHEHDNAR